MTGLCRVATRAAMYKAAGTRARPPQTRTTPAQGAALTVEWGYAHQGGDGLARELPQFGNSASKVQAVALLATVTGAFKNGPVAVDDETHRAFVLDPYYNTMTVLANSRLKVGSAAATRVDAHVFPETRHNLI